jgi:hypothetical protein
MGFADQSLGKRAPRDAGSSRSSAMMFALGAVSSAIDALQSLTSSKPSSPLAGGFSQNAGGLFDVSGGSASSAGSAAASGASGFSQISPVTMSALIAAQGQSSAGSATEAPAGRSQALQDLFSQIDADGDGQVSKSEFENALGAGGTNIAQADDVFSKLDKDGDGSITLSDLSSALKGAGHGDHHAAGFSASGSTDPLAQALQGATSTSVTDSDGSTTTSLTLPDGSKVTMTSPTATTAASAATSSYNSIEQMIKREAKAISFSAIPALSLNA